MHLDCSNTLHSQDVDINAIKEKWTVTPGYSPHG